MKRNINLPMNRIAGFLVGFIAAIFVLNEGMFLSAYLGVKGIVVNTLLLKMLCYLMATVVFYGIAKYFNRKKENRLTMYIIIALVSSAAIIIVLVLSVCRIVFHVIDQQGVVEYLNTEAGAIIMWNVSFLLVVGVLGLFFLLFGLMVGHKVRYINYITGEVKKLEASGFGRTIDVKGQDELSDLSTTINAMSVAIDLKTKQEKRLKQQKNELITSVSHDLRTPLTSIIGYVELLKKADSLTAEESKEYLEVVERRLYGLNHMINELFEYTKIDSMDFTLQFEEINAKALLMHVISEYQMIYQKSGKILQSDIDCENITISADVERFVRVLSNLLDNALKYSRKESPVIIRAAVSEGGVADGDSGKGMLKITCSNETDSIQPDDMEHLFLRFYKSDQSRSDSSSSGLGLSIVKRIVELHHGTVTASLEGKVITFTVLIPVI